MSSSTQSLFLKQIRIARFLVVLRDGTFIVVIVLRGNTISKDKIAQECINGEMNFSEVLLLCRTRGWFFETI